jgi:hypothetical protein
MNYSPILAPVVALVAWTLVVMAWMVVTRVSAMNKAGIDLKSRVGGRGANLEGAIPDEVMWKSHNYQHLVEQPTLFYAIAFVLALMDRGGGINLWLAWGYVALRIVHSLIQATYNRVMHRFLVFGLASLCLIGLTVHAAFHMLRDCGFIG